MQAQKIVLVTDRDSVPEYENLNTENGKLFTFLKEKGLQVSYEIWDDENVDWSQFDAVVIKTPWDYYYRIHEFTAWLDKLERIGSYVLNPIKMLRWNSDKIYFKDMEKEGVKLVSTIWLAQGENFDVEKIFAELNTEKIIVKPRVSGGAKHTYALTKEEALAKKEEIEKYLQEEAYMAQPFLKEIQTKGEWALLFYNGKYSHSVLKTAKANDFRVQHTHGGTIHKIDAAASLVATAQNIVDKFAQDCLYTRVDGLEIDGEFILMELEALEPHLFLMQSETAFEMYYQGLLSFLEKKNNKN